MRYRKNVRNGNFVKKNSVDRFVRKEERDCRGVERRTLSLGL